MATITLRNVLDDLRTADQVLRKFEQRYWISSDIFYDLYSQGRLDDGGNLQDLASGPDFTRSSSTGKTSCASFPSSALPSEERRVKAMRPISLPLSPRSLN